MSRVRAGGRGRRPMGSQTYELQWYGPYKWYGTTDDCIFTRSEAKKSGIYLWTIPFKKQYLTYYVGETGKSFASRHIWHARDYLHGLYRVYDPHQFGQGTKILVWGGMWKPGRRGAHHMLEFLNQYPELSSVIYEFLGKFSIFLAPLDVKERVRKRIEAAVANRLYEQPGLFGKFQDTDIRYHPRQPDEEPISVTMVSFEPILGLCSELTA